MNKKLKQLTSLAKKNNLKLLPVMEKLTKEQVAVKVTDNNRKHIAKTLKMFGQKTYSNDTLTHKEYNSIVVSPVSGRWCNSSVIHYKTPISHKQLRNILAKEHLKEGDHVVCYDREYTAIGVFKEWDSKFGFDLDNCYYDKDSINGEGGCFDNFKRYATIEEVSLLEGNKDLVVGKWYIYNETGSIIFNRENGTGYGINAYKIWIEKAEWLKYDKDNGVDFSLATPQEVEYALTQQAVKLGHKYEKFVYNSEENELCGYNNGRLEEVFIDGKWNEPVDKFAELKEAHKNGEVIQVKCKYTGNWNDIDYPIWNENHKNEYRIKPVEKPKVIWKELLIQQIQTYEKSTNDLVNLCHGLSNDAGWHDKPREVGTMLALIHSEVSEALEGFRKDLNDDHLTNRKMAEVELADAVIRIFDLAGAQEFDLGGALVEKLSYNTNRADHKFENRDKQNGKKF